MKDELKLIKPFDINNEKNIVGLMQHYSYPTRCLDLTSNLFTALFFALPKQFNQKEDAALWVIDRNKLLERYLNKDRSRYHFLDSGFTKGIDKLNLVTSTNYQTTLIWKKCIIIELMLYQKIGITTKIIVLNIKMEI